MAIQKRLNEKQVAIILQNGLVPFKHQKYGWFVRKRDSSVRHPIETQWYGPFNHFGLIVKWLVEYKMGNQDAIERKKW